MHLVPPPILARAIVDWSGLEVLELHGGPTAAVPVSCEDISTYVLRMSQAILYSHVHREMLQARLMSGPQPSRSVQDVLADWQEAARVGGGQGRVKLQIC